MRKLLGVITAIILLSGFPETSALYTNLEHPDDAVSIDIPVSEFVLNHFLKGNYFIHSTDTELITSKDQFIGILALLRLYNTTTNDIYKESAESVWNYTEIFYDKDERLYRFSHDDEEKFTETNAYAILASLRLYGETDNTTYLDRARSIASKLKTFISEELFYTSDINHTFDIKTQGIVSLAFFGLYNATEMQSYKNTAMNVLDACIDNYLNDGFEIDGMYKSIDNAVMGFVNALAYQISNDQRLNETAEKGSDFIRKFASRDESIEGERIRFVEKAVEKKGSNYTSVGVPRALDQIWTYIAWIKSAEVTGNDSYLLASEILSKSMLLKFWDFENGGFYDDEWKEKKGFESNGLAIIAFASDYEIELRSSYSSIIFRIPSKRYTEDITLDDYRNSLLSTFTIFSKDAGRKTIFESVDRIGAYPVPFIPVVSTEPYIQDEEGNISALKLDYSTGRYFFWNASFNKGVNNYSLILSDILPVAFLNSSFTKNSIHLNFTTYNISIPVSVSEFFLRSFDLDITAVKVVYGTESKGLNFVYSKSERKVSIEKLVYKNSTQIIFEYTDEVKPTVSDIQFLNKKVYGDEIQKGRVNEDVWVACKVDENNILDEVRVFYNDGKGWRNVSMSFFQGKYRACIGNFSEGKVEIYILAKDISGNTYKSETMSINIEREDDYTLMIIASVIATTAVVCLTVWSVKRKREIKRLKERMKSKKKKMKKGGK